MTTVLPFDIVIGNLQMQPNKEGEKEKNKGEAKLKLSVCTRVVPNYSILQPVGVSVSRQQLSILLRFCHRHSISLSGLSYCTSLGPGIQITALNTDGREGSAKYIS